MFSLREFILKGLKDMIGKVEDYTVIMNAVSWNKKGVLKVEDLEEINNLIDEKNAPKTNENENIDTLEETETNDTDNDEKSILVSGV